MESIRRITSFDVDHNKLKKGFYVSRRDGDITTYDLRTRIPNSDNFMDNVTMHTVEHMFATYIRNSEIADSVIYFGPMGCQTGFYLLTRGLEDSVVFENVKKVLDKIISHTGEVFGKSAVECGNYRSLELECAKTECREYRKVLDSVKSFSYGEQI